MKSRTTVDLLEPQTTADPYTEEQRPDWKKDPTTTAGVPAAVEPVSSTEQALTAGTIVSRWTLYVDVNLGTVEQQAAAAAMTSDWRVSWRGEVYTIDGEVEVWQGRHGEAYRSCVLKRVTG